MPSLTQERRLWPPQSDTEADLVELVRLKPELAPLALVPAASCKPKRSKPAVASKPFIHIDLDAFLAGAAAVNSAAELTVWVYILREQRCRSIGQAETFPLPNAGLAAWGVSRKAKARALRKFAAAGLIKIERAGQSSPRVVVCGAE